MTIELRVREDNGWARLSLDVGSEVCMYKARSRYDHTRGYHLVRGKVARVTPKGTQFVVAYTYGTDEAREARFVVGGYNKDQADEHGVDKWAAQWHICTPEALARMHADQVDSDARRALAARVNEVMARLSGALEPLGKRDLDETEITIAATAIEQLRTALATIRRGE